MDPIRSQQVTRLKTISNKKKYNGYAPQINITLRRKYTLLTTLYKWGRNCPYGIYNTEWTSQCDHVRSSYELSAIRLICRCCAQCWRCLLHKHLRRQSLPVHRHGCKRGCCGGWFHPQRCPTW